jgi:predicted site-specific integrase-resolvase
MAALKEELRLISSRETAALLNVSDVRLSQWRKAGQGPKSILVGGTWIYREEDVLDFKQTYQKRGAK